MRAGSAGESPVIFQAGSYLRLIDSCITQLKDHRPSRTCNESKEEEEDLKPKTLNPTHTPGGLTARGDMVRRRRLFEREEGRQQSESIIEEHPGMFPLRTSRFKPWTMNPQPLTLKPQPWTLNPQPSTLNPQPWTLNPEPCTMNPEP